MDRKGSDITSNLTSPASSSSVFPAISLAFTVLLLLQRSQLYLWGSPFFFFFSVPSYISGVHRSSSSSAFPAISLGFTILGEIFACVTLFNPTIEVVTFRKKIILGGGSNPRRCIKQRSEPNTLPTSYSGPAKLV